MLSAPIVDFARIYDKQQEGYVMLFNLLIGLSAILFLAVLYFQFCRESNRDFLLPVVAYFTLTVVQNLGGSILIIQSRHLVIPFMLVGLMLRYRDLTQNKKTKFFWVVALMFWMPVIATSWAQSRGIMRGIELPNSFKCFLCILAGYLFSSARDFKKLLLLLLPTAVYIVIVARTGIVDIGDDGRLSINEVNQNGVGVMAGFASFVFFANIIYGVYPKAVKMCLWPMLGATLWMTGASGSRTAIAATVGCLSCCSLRYFTSRKRVAYGLGLLVLGLIVLSVVFYKLPKDVVGRMFDYSDSSGRDMIWENLRYEIGHYNPLIGSGGSYWIDIYGNFKWRGFLNIYYDFYNTCGLLGVLLGCVFLFSFAAKAWIIWRKLDSDLKYPILGMCVFGFLHGVGEDGPIRYGNVSGFLFQVGLGLFSGLSLRNNQKYVMDAPLKKPIIRLPRHENWNM